MELLVDEGEILLLCRVGPPFGPLDAIGALGEQVGQDGLQCRPVVAASQCLDSLVVVVGLQQRRDRLVEQRGRLPLVERIEAGGDGVDADGVFA